VKKLACEAFTVCISVLQLVEVGKHIGHQINRISSAPSAFICGRLLLLNDKLKHIGLSVWLRRRRLVSAALAIKD